MKMQLQIFSSLYRFRFVGSNSLLSSAGLFPRPFLLSYCSSSY